MLNLVVAIRTLGAFLLPFLYHAFEVPNFLGRGFRLIANSPPSISARAETVSRGSKERSNYTAETLINAHAGE
jgi:hypothetical protein